MKLKNYRTNQRILILIFLFVIPNPGLLAKERIVDGYYVTAKGDTIKAKFLIPLMNVKKIDTSGTNKFEDDVYTRILKIKYPRIKKLQWKLYCLNDSGKKVKLTPGNCVAWHFNFNSETFNYVAISKYAFDKPVFYTFHPNDSMFIRLLIPGQLSLYQYFKPKGTFFMIYSTYAFILTGGSSSLFLRYLKLSYCLKKEGDDKIHNYNKLFFRKNLIKYLSDCYITVFKLEEKVYSDKDIVQIVKEYNSFKRLSP